MRNPRLGITTRTLSELFNHATGTFKQILSPLFPRADAIQYDLIRNSSVSFCMREIDAGDEIICNSLLNT